MLFDQIAEQSKKFNKHISSDHFQNICGETSLKKVGEVNVQSRLSKQKFKQYLTIKFGNNFAEKMVNVLDFSANNIDFPAFCGQIEMLLKDRTFLL